MIYFAVNMLLNIELCNYSVFTLNNNLGEGDSNATCCIACHTPVRLGQTVSTATGGDESTIYRFLKKSKAEGDIFGLDYMRMVHLAMVVMVLWLSVLVLYFQYACTCL